MTSSRNEGFGELRSLMQHQALDASQRASLWALMTRAWEADPLAYREKWLAYMRAYPRHFLESLVIFSDIETLTRAAPLAPCACFCLDVSNNSLGAAGARALARSPHLAQLTFLGVFDNEIGEEGLRALATSTYLREELRQGFAR